MTAETGKMSPRGVNPARESIPMEQNKGAHEPAVCIAVRMRGRVGVPFALQQ